MLFRSKFFIFYLGQMPILFASALLNVTFPSAFAQSAQWIGGGPTPHWSEAGNWTPSNPETGDDAIVNWIPESYEYAPQYDLPDSTIKSLLIGGQGLGGYLSFKENTKLTVTGDLVISGEYAPMLTLDRNQAALTVNGNITIGDTAGDRGTELRLEQGAQFNQQAGQNTILGKVAGSNGYVFILDNATHANFGNLSIGGSGGGILDVSKGAQVTAENAVAGSDASATGTIRLKGADTNAGFSSLTVAKDGTGTLYLSDQATLNVESDFVIASSIGAKGKLYIGNPTTLVAPGSVTARSIHFGDGDGEVILNHTAPVEAPYVLDMPISGTGTITNLNGATYLTANNTYTGPTSVKAGLLGLIGSGVSDISVSGGTLYVAGSTTGAVDLQIGGTLTGSGSVGNLTNAGIINPSRNTSTYGLTINGDYIGKGGTLVIDAVTGDDSSVTDTLIIKGSTSGGATLVVVNGLSGIGTKPHHDIRIVSVGGSSGAPFTLQADHITADGQSAVSAGAYSYVLHSGGDGWYLQNYSTNDDQPPEIHYNPGVPLYSSYFAGLSLFNSSMIETLQDRTGNRFWQPKTPSRPGEAAQSGLIWTRMIGSASHYRLDSSTTDNKINLTRWGLQGGGEFELSDTSAGQFHTSLWLNYRHQQTQVASAIGNGNLTTYAYGVGGAATWYGSNGLYVDGQAQLTFYNTNIYSREYAEELASGKKAQGYNVSLEAGKQFTAGLFSTITPQLQLAYSSFIPSDFNGLHASELAYSNFNSLIARAGGSFRSTINRTASSATDLTIDANYYRELLDNQSTFNIGPTTLDAGIAAKNTVELGMGFTRRWAHGNQTAFGRMNVKINPLDPRDAYQISGNIGYRLGW